MGFQQLLNQVGELKQKAYTGASKSAEASRLAYLQGERNPTILKEAPGLKNLTRQQYHQNLEKLGVSFKETPVEATAAFATRLMTDLTNDGTRGIYWRYNHPLAILEAGAKAALGEKAYEALGPTKTGLITASIAVPVTAVAGAYNILNPGEMFRPKGFAQAYAAEGSEDRRETTQPVPELFERFFLGRTGRPLAYEEAQKDIPSLTPERYGNYLRNYYQDKGFLGLIKATPENLEGVPEARMLGYPITIPSVTAAVGGIAGAATAIRTAPKLGGSFRRGLGGAALGTGAGIIAGNLANTALAAKATEQKLPTVGQYEIMQ
jgi:Ni,Fe-hydrogenase III small subunit